MAALEDLGRLRVPLPYMCPDGRIVSGGVSLVHASYRPDDWGGGEAPVVLTVRIPAGSAAGARLDFDRLCRYGADSAALYRAYLAVVTALDRSAHHGAPVTRYLGRPILGGDGLPRRRKGGFIVRDPTILDRHPLASVAPTWTDRDAARVIGLNPESRVFRQRARAVLERLAADGAVEIEHVSHDRFRLFGPARQSGNYR